MKNIFLTLALVALTVTTALGQIPREISYQGLLTDPAGNTIADGAHSLAVRLYEDASATTAIYTETQNVTVAKGVFSLTIGTSNPLPASVRFDKKYFLGVSVDGAAELTPRTVLTASPYALFAANAGNAATADKATALAPGATGVVTSVNNLSGAITMQGGGGTTVTQNAGVITISSTGGAGGTGIQGVQNTDGTFTITNANGPVATLNLANGMITGLKLAPDAVTSDKIANGTITAADIASGVIPTIPSSLPPNGNAGGDLTGAYPNPTIAAGTITTAKLQDGSVTGAKLAAGVIPTALPPNGTAGGDLSGTYPNPVIAGNAVTTAKIADGALTTAKIADGAVTAAKIAAGVIPTALPPNGTAGGDLSGTYPNPGVAKIKGVALSSLAPTTGNVLKFNGTAWEAGTDALGNLVLPFSGSNSANGTTFSVTGTGTGVIGSFTNNNTANTQSAVLGSTNSAGGGAAVEGSATGTLGAAGLFRIFNASSAGDALFGSTAGTGAALKVNHTGASGNIAVFQSGNTPVARIDKTGKGFFNGGTQTGGADVAEAFAVTGNRAEYQPGDVLVISETADRTVEKSTSANSVKVVGVYATKPGVLLTERGSEQNLDDLVPMGVVGVIPTKVCAQGGVIRRGDMLVTSDTPGCAMKANEATVRVGAVIGKALQDFNGDTGIINVLVNPR